MWNEICSKVFRDLIEEYNKNNIKYIIFRNYENLPQKNDGKDIDIIVGKNYFKLALKLLKDIYKRNGLKYYDESIFDTMYCTHGIGLVNKTGIHIDLLCGFRAKGYEIIDFDTLYANTEDYNGFKVLTKEYDSLMLFISKLFGQKRPKLKDKYKIIIRQSLIEGSLLGKKILEFFGDNEGRKIIDKIKANNFEYVLNSANYINKSLKKYCIKKHPIKSVLGHMHYAWQKFYRVFLRYRKYKRCFAVLAPDGTGKTTFLESVQEKLRYYYVNDKWEDRMSVYHFRPNILPNLGAMGEKAGVMKQDTDFTNPHRSKPANPISSFIRMGYYMLDYIIGWSKVVRSDVRNDKYSIFDRYSYDFIVDPVRSKISLPYFIRKIFVGLTPKPDIIFVLQADKETIYNRKQELTLDEIERQLGEYKRVAKGKRFKIIDANNTPDIMSNEALEIIMDYYCK